MFSRKPIFTWLVPLWEWLGVAWCFLFPFLLAGLQTCPAIEKLTPREIYFHLLLTWSWALLQFPSLPSFSCLWGKLVISFHSWYWNWQKFPPRCDSYVVGTIPWFPAGDCFPALAPSPFSLVISVIFLEGNGACVYVVILPVSLLFIFSSIFFLNLADVKKLLKFAFLDYKLVWTFSQTFVSICIFSCTNCVCLRLDHWAVGVLQGVSKNICMHFEIIKELFLSVIFDADIWFSVMFLFLCSEHFLMAYLTYDQSPELFSFLICLPV